MYTDLKGSARNRTFHLTITEFQTGIPNTIQRRTERFCKLILRKNSECWIKLAPLGHAMQNMFCVKGQIGQLQKCLLGSQRRFRYLILSRKDNNALMFSVKHNYILLFNSLATRFGHQTVIRPSLYKI